MTPITIADRWHVVVPDHRAPPWTGWEIERLASMADNLEPGDVVLDIGTEQGDASAVIAGMVGGDAMVLVESEPTAWPNIRQTWEANGLARPLSCVVGLLSDVDKPIAGWKHGDPSDGWPACAWGDQLQTYRSYRYICHQGEVTPQVRLDTWATWTGIIPAALNIDVEGAELAVLTGAEETLAVHRPLVWVSLHPDLMANWYGHTPLALSRYMESLGYHGTHLATDHEEHWIFRP